MNNKKYFLNNEPSRTKTAKKLLAACVLAAVYAGGSSMPVTSVDELLAKAQDNAIKVAENTLQIVDGVVENIIFSKAQAIGTISTGTTINNTGQNYVIEGVGFGFNISANVTANVTGKNLTIRTTAAVGSGTCGYPIRITNGTVNLTSSSSGTIYLYSANDHTIYQTGGVVNINSSGNLRFVSGSTNHAGIRVDSGKIILNGAAGSTLNDRFYSTVGGGMYLVTSATAELTGLRLQNNATSGGTGGGIYVGSSSTLKVTSGTFVNNTASTGGATAKGNIAAANSGKGYGGAIGNVGTGKVTISNTLFTGNLALNGGAIYNAKAQLDITGGTFKNNDCSSVTTSRGGAIYNDTSGTVNISETTNFEGNKVYQDGAAIYTKGTVNLSGTTTFKNNTASAGTLAGGTTGWGGAIYLTGTSAVVNFSGTATFTDNHALYANGRYKAIMGAGGSTLNFDSGANVTFNDNQNIGSWDTSGQKLNVKSGGMIFLKKLTLSNQWTITNAGNMDLSGTTVNSHIENNSGTIVTSGSGATYTTFSSNTAVNGGAINANGGTLTIEKTMFTNNTATSNGGAIQLDKNSSVTITNGTFTNNSAGNAGGAIFTYGNINNHPVLTVKNSLFQNNTANQGGAIFYCFGTDSGTISGSTFKGNKAMGSNNGGAISIQPYNTSSGTFGDTNAFVLEISDSIFGGTADADQNKDKDGINDITLWGTRASQTINFKGNNTFYGGIRSKVSDQSFINIVSGTTTLLGTAYMTGDSSTNNVGTVNISSGATLDMSGSTGNFISISTTSSGTFKTSSGTVAVSSGSSFINNDSGYLIANNNVKFQAKLNNKGRADISAGTFIGAIDNTKTINLSGTGLVTGGLTNNTGGTVSQSGGTIKTGAVTNSAAIDVTGGEISSVITNNSSGTIKVTAGKISGNVSNSGFVTTGANLFTATITNASNAQVTLTGSSVNLTGTIAGSGTVNIGTSDTAAQITNTNNKQITAGSLAITNASSSLSTSLSNVNISNNTITNYGTLTFTNGLITDKFHNIIDDKGTRTGILNINGGDLNVGSYSIKQKGLSIGSSGKLTSDISKIDISDGTIMNKGVLTLNGTGTLKNVLQDTTGKLYVDGTITSDSVAIFNATTINNAGQLTIDADDMRNTVTTNGVLVLKSNNIDDDGTGTHIDTLRNSVSGTGYIVIDGNITNAAGSVISVEGNKIGEESYGIKIGAADKSFTAENATNIQTSIDNSVGGKVTFNGGVFSRDVNGDLSSGTAQTFINGSVTFNNAINDRIEVKEGANLTITANNVNADIFGNSSAAGNSTVSLRNGELNYAIRKQDGSASPSGNVVILDGQSVTLGLNGKIGTNNLTLNPNSVLTFVNDANASAEVDLAQNLVVNSATLDLRDVKNRTYKVNGNISGYDATLHFDMINVSEGDHKILKGRYVSDGGTDEGYLSYAERDVFSVTNGTVGGTFKLGSINMTGSIYMYQRGDEVYAWNRGDGSYTTVTGGTITGEGAERKMTNGTTPDGKVIAGPVSVGIIGEISEDIIKEGDLEIDRIVLFGNGTGDAASTSNLTIKKTTTKYGSFAYTFEQWGTNSPALRITAQPAELTLIEVINGRSMSGVTQGTAAHQFTQDEINAAYANATDTQKLNDFEVVSGTDYKFKDNLSETDKDKYRKYNQIMEKQVRMATQAASFNTYSFDQDTTMAKPFETYKKLYDAAVGTGKMFTSYSQAALSLAGISSGTISAAMNAMLQEAQGGPAASNDAKRLVYASMLVKTKATLDAILKDVDPNYNLMMDYVVYSGTTKTDQMRWSGDPQELTTGTYFLGLAGGTEGSTDAFTDILSDYDARIAEKGLGTLTPSNAGGTRDSRVLTLNGNGFSLEGGQIVNTLVSQGTITTGFKGVNLSNPRDEMYIVNVKSVSGFDEYVVNNQGSLYLQDTQSGLVLSADVIDSKDGKINKSGITYIDNSKLTITKGNKIEQLRVEIDTLSEVTAHATGLIANSIKNLGTINMYGGEYDGVGVTTGSVAELKANISGTGLLHITRDPISGGSGANIKADEATVIANKIKIDDGSEFEISANSLMGESVQNLGGLTLDEGILVTNVIDSGTTAETTSGTTYINGDIFVNNDVQIVQKAMTIDGSITGRKTLTVQADHLTVYLDINNNGNLQITGNNVDFNNSVVGSGTTIIDGKITAKKRINQEIDIKDNLDKLTIDVDLLGSAGTVKNNGIVVLTGNGVDEDLAIVPSSTDTLQKVIEGGEIVINSPTYKITSDVDNLKSNKITNNESQLVLLGGSEDNDDSREELTTSIYGANGHTIIGSDTVIGNAFLQLADGVRIENIIDIKSKNSLVIGAENILQAINNDGILHLTGGELGVDIKSLTLSGGSSYVGTTVIDGEVVARSARNIHQGTLAISPAGRLTVNADTLDIRSAEGTYTPIVNRGVLTLTGGSLRNASVGITDGTTMINGELHSEGEEVAIMDNWATVTSDIYISKDSTLTMNALNLQGVVKDNKGTLVVDVAENILLSLGTNQREAVAGIGGLPVAKPIYGTGKVVVNNKTADNPNPNEQLTLIDIAPFEAGEVVIEKGSLAAIPNLVHVGEKGITNNGRLTFIGLDATEVTQYLVTMGSMGMQVPYAAGSPEYQKAIGAVDNVLGIDGLQTVSTKIGSSSGTTGEIVIGMGKNTSKVFIDGDIINQNIVVAGGILYVDPDTLYGKVTGLDYDASVTLAPRNIDIKTGNVIEEEENYNDLSTIIVPQGKGGTFNQMVAGQGEVELNAPVNMGEGSGFVPVAFINMAELQVTSGASGTYLVSQNPADGDIDDRVENAEYLSTKNGFNPATGDDEGDAFKVAWKSAYNTMQTLGTACDIAKVNLENAERTGMKTTDPSAYMTAKDNYVNAYQNWRSAVETYSSFQSIPISAISVKINDTFTIGNSENLKGGGISSLTIGSNGHLNLVNDDCGTLLIGTGDMTTAALKAHQGSRLSLDIESDMKMDSIVVLGKAEGVLTLATLNVKDEIMPEYKLDDGEAQMAVRWVPLTILDDNDFSIVGTTTAYGDYIYTITYEKQAPSDSNKKLKIIKQWGFTLPEIIQATKNSTYRLEAAKISTYSFSENAVNTNHTLVKGGDLGTFRQEEYQVINDGSTPNSKEINLTDAKNYAANRVAVGDKIRYNGKEYTVVETVSDPTKEKSLIEAKDIARNSVTLGKFVKDRNFSINGNKTTLNGGGFEGMTVDSKKDILNITDISKLDNFKDGLLGTNKGTLNIKGTNTTQLAASVKGDGILNVSTNLVLENVGYTTTKVVDFKGQEFRKNNKGLYVDSQNNVLDDQSIENVRVKGVIERYDTRPTYKTDADGYYIDESGEKLTDPITGEFINTVTEYVEDYAAIDKENPIPGWYVGGRFYTLEDAVTNAFINYYTTGSKTFNVADGVTVKLNVPVIEQNTMNIESGSLTANADQLKISNSIMADGNLKLTGGTLKNNISGKGTVFIDGDLVNEETGEVLTRGHVVLNGTIGNKIAIYQNNSLTMNASNIFNTVTNDGNLELTGGILNKAVTKGDPSVTDSVITITGDVVSDAEYLGNKVQINANKSLTLNNGNISNDISGAMGSKLIIDNGIEDGEKIRNDAQISGISILQIEAGNTFITDASALTLAAGGEVINKGIFEYTGDTEIKNDITDGKRHTTALNDLEGTLNLTGDFILNDANIITQGTINIIGGTSSSLTALADNLTADELDNSGVLTIYGDGAVIKHTHIGAYKDETGVTTMGTTVIDGKIESRQKIDNAIVINQNKQLTLDAGLIGGDVTDNGKLILTGTGTSGELSHEIKHGLSEIADVQIGQNNNNSKVVNQSGNTLQIDSLDVLSGSEFTVSMDDMTVTNNIINDGTIHLAGGVLNNAVIGDGITDVISDSEIRNSIQNKIVVEDATQLRIKPENILNGIELVSDYNSRTYKDKIGNTFNISDPSNGMVSLNNDPAQVIVDEAGDFSSQISGVGKVVIEKDVAMVEGSGFEVQYAVDLGKLTAGTGNPFVSGQKFQNEVMTYLGTHSADLNVLVSKYMTDEGYDRATATAYAQRAMIAKYSEEKYIVPMSNLSVDLNARLSIENNSISGGGLAALTMGQNGYLDFADGSCGNLIVGSFDAGRTVGSKLSLDVANDNQMDGFVVLGDAKGTLSLETVNVQDELIKGREIQEYTKTEENVTKTYYKGIGVNEGIWFNSNFQKIDAPTFSGMETGRKLYGTISGGSVFFYDKNGLKTTDTTEFIPITQADVKSLVAWQDLPIYGKDNLEINGTRTAFGEYLYTFSYEYNRDEDDKQLKIVKDKGFSMRQVIQGDVREATVENNVTVRAASVNTYAYTTDAFNVAVINFVNNGTLNDGVITNGTVVVSKAVGGGNLGILTRDDDTNDWYCHDGSTEDYIGGSPTNIRGRGPEYEADKFGSWISAGSGAGQELAGTGRTLNINGNGHSLTGMGWEGVRVNSGDGFVLSNISEVSNFKNGIVADNNGTLKIEKGTMNVKAGVSGNGVLEINGANVRIENNETAFNNLSTGSFANFATYYFDKGIIAMDIASDADGNVLTGANAAQTLYVYENETGHTGSIALTNSEVAGITKFYTPKITQNVININKGSLTASGYALDVNTINNDATLTIIDNYNIDAFVGNNPDDIVTNDNTLKAAVTGLYGNLVVDAKDLKAEKEIANIVTINAGKQLTIDAGNLNNKVTLLSTDGTNGKLVLTSVTNGSLGGNAVLTGGEIYIGSTSTQTGTGSTVDMMANQLDRNKLVAIDPTSVLKLSGGTLLQEIGNNDHYTGTLEIAGTSEENNVLIWADIWTNIEVDNDKTMTTTTDHLKNNTHDVLTTVRNNGVVVLTGGSAPLTKKIEGTLTGGSLITGGVLRITGDVASDAGNIASYTNIVDEDVTLTLTGGELIKGISGDGSADVDTLSSVQVLKTNEKLDTKGGIKVSKGTLNILADNIGDYIEIDVKDGGVVSLTANEDTSYVGILDNSISGGTISIDEFVTGTPVTISTDIKYIEADAVFVNKNNVLEISNTNNLHLSTPIYGDGIATSGGTTVIQSSLISDVEISTPNIYLLEDNTLTIAADHVGGDLTNVVSGGVTPPNENAKVILKDLSAAGATNKLKHSVQVREIQVSGNVTTDADNLLSKKVNIDAEKKLTLTSGTTEAEFNGNGDLHIKAGTVANAVELKNKVHTDIVIESGSLTIDANNVLSDGTVFGSEDNFVEINISGGTAGVFNSTLTGTGGLLNLNQKIEIGSGAVFVPQYFIDIESNKIIQPANLTPAQQAKIGTTILPMSNIDVNINNTLTNAQDETAQGKSGGFNNVTFSSNGHLDLRNDKQDYFIMKNMTADYGSNISMDLISVDSIDTFYVLGKAQGRLKVGNLNVKSDIMAGIIDETKINERHDTMLAQMPVLGENKLFIQGTNVDYEQYRYTLREVILKPGSNIITVENITGEAPTVGEQRDYDSWTNVGTSNLITADRIYVGAEFIDQVNRSGKEMRLFALTKEIGYNLHQVIQGFIRDNGEEHIEGRYSYGADALNYTFNGSDMVNTMVLNGKSEKLAVGYGLGMLTRKVEIRDEAGYAMEDLNGYGIEENPQTPDGGKLLSTGSRILTLNGNGGRMFGGGTAGLKINQGDKVIVKNMPLVDDFQDGLVAANEGTLQIGDGLSDKVVLNGKVTGNGTVQIGGKVTLGDEYHNYEWSEVTDEGEINAGNFDVKTSLSGVDYYLSMNNPSSGASLIDQKSIHVLQDSSLTANANLLKASDESGIIVDGTLILTGGVTQSVITSTSEITTGVVQIGIDGSEDETIVEATKEIKSSNLIINENAKLIATDASGILSSNIITNNGFLEVKPNNLQPSNAEHDVINEGTIDLIAGTLDAANIDGNGVVNIHGALVKSEDKSITAGSIIMKNIGPTNGATLTTDASTLHGNIMIEDQAILTLSKGTVAGNVSGNVTSGTMVIDGGGENAVSAGGTITDVLVTINSGKTLNMIEDGLIDTTHVTNNGTLTGAGSNFATTAVVTNNSIMEVKSGVLDTEIENTSGRIIADNGATVDAKVSGGKITGVSNTGNTFTVTNSKDTDRYTDNVVIYAGNGIEDGDLDSGNTLNISGKLGNNTKIYANDSGSSANLNNILHITDSKTEVGFVGSSSSEKIFNNYVFDVESEDATSPTNNISMLTLHQGYKFQTRRNDIFINGNNLAERSKYVLVDNSVGNGVELLGDPTGFSDCKFYKSYNITATSTQIILEVEGINIENKNILGDPNNDNSAALITGRRATGGTVGGTDEFVSVTAIDAAGYAKNNKIYVADNTDENARGDNTIVYGQVFGARGATEASNNETIVYGKIKGVGVNDPMVVGAYSNSGNVDNNTLYIKSGAEVSGTVIGGETETGSLSGNKVIIEGTTGVSGKNTDIFGARTSSGTLNNNGVIIGGTDLNPAEIIGDIVNLYGDNGTGTHSYVDFVGKTGLSDGLTLNVEADKVTVEEDATVDNSNATINFNRGDTVIDGTISDGTVNLKDNTLLGTNGVIDGSELSLVAEKVLTVTDAAGLQTTSVDNYGTIVLSSGTLSSEITSGTTKEDGTESKVVIGGNVTLNAKIGTVTEEGEIIGNNIIVNKGAVLNTEDAANIAGTADNSGKINLTGGTLASEIFGTGTTYINENNVKSDVHYVGSKFVVAEDEELILTGDNTYDDDKVGFDKIKGTISGKGTTVIGDGTVANITTQGEISTAITISNNASLFAMGENILNAVEITGNAVGSDKDGVLRLLGGTLDNQVTGDGIMTLADMSLNKTDTLDNNLLSKPVVATLGKNGYVNTNVVIPKNGIIDFRAGKFDGAKSETENYNIDVKDGGTFVAKMRDLLVPVNGEEKVEINGKEYPKYVEGDIAVLGNITDQNVGTYELSLGRDYYLSEYKQLRNTMTGGSAGSKLQLTITDGNLIPEGDGTELVYETRTTRVIDADHKEEITGGRYNSENGNSRPTYTVIANDLRAIISEKDKETGETIDSFEIRSMPKEVLDVTPDGHEGDWVDELSVTDTKGTTVKALEVTGLQGRNIDEETGKAVFTLNIGGNDSVSELTIVGDGKDLVTAKYGKEDDEGNDRRIGSGQGRNNVDVNVEKDSILKVGIYSGNKDEQGAKLQNINVEGGTFSAISSTVTAKDIDVKGKDNSTGSLLANGFADINATKLTLSDGTAMVSVGDLAKVKVNEFNVTASSGTVTNGISLGEIKTSTTKIKSAKRVDEDGNVVLDGDSNEIIDEATLYVGNDAGSSKISTNTLEGDGVIVLDPLYVDNIEQASHFAVNSTNITDTKIMVGRNSVLSLGTDDYKKSVELFNKLGKGFGTGTKGNITAAVYVDKPITLQNDAKIYVDGTVSTDTKAFHQGGENYSNGIYFGANSILMVNVANLYDNVAITTNKSAKVDANSMLCLHNAVAGKTYKILKSDGIISLLDNGWLKKNVFGSVFMDFEIDSGNDFYNIKVTKADNPPGPVPPGPDPVKRTSVIEAILNGGDTPAYRWLSAASMNYYSNKEINDHINAMMNMAEAGGVMHGMATMVDTFDDSIFSQIGMNIREGKKYRNAKMQNTVNEKVGAPSIDDINITKLPVAKTAEIMPQVPEYSEESPFVHEKRVWASYVHNKEKVSGMNLGDNFEGKYDMSVNGATIGADLWSGETSFGGISLMYSDGTITGSSGASTKNEVEYFGVGVYNRKDLKNSISLMYDMTYINGENDIKQNNSGVEVTAKPKTKTISAGFRFEKMYDIKNCKLVPFAGLRYMNIDGDKYDNSIGLHYDAGKMNVFSLPLGIKIAGKEVTNSSGWGFKPYGELGYMVNFGDTDNNVEVSYGNGRDNVGYDVLDKGMFFAKVGFAISNKNMLLTLGYDYTKSSNAHNNKWNISANFTF